LDADVQAALTDVVELLGGLPLALEQAGNYMREAECTFVGYKNRFERVSLVDFFGRKEAEADSLHQSVPLGDLATILQSLSLGGDNLGYADKMSKAGINTPDDLLEKLIH
jgi:hypothetical protein